MNSEPAEPNTDLLTVETEPVSGTEAEIFAVTKPRLLRLKRLRAGAPIGYLCLRATDMVRWVLTRHYDIEVFGTKGHDVWEGSGHPIAVATLYIMVEREREKSLREFGAAVDHLRKCAAQEAAGIAFPPRGFRPGWAKAMVPKAIESERANARQWTTNFAALRDRLTESGWPSTAADQIVHDENLLRRS